jgi:hypothetical protein
MQIKEGPSTAAVYFNWLAQLKTDNHYTRPFIHLSQWTNHSQWECIDTTLKRSAIDQNSSTIHHRTHRKFAQVLPSFKTRLVILVLQPQPRHPSRVGANQLHAGGRRPRPGAAPPSHDRQGLRSDILYKFKTRTIFSPIKYDRYI